MRDFTTDPIVERITIQAPIDRCFALSTSVELVQRTLGMKLVGGTTVGHITANSRVVWRGWKFGLPTEHHTLITGFAAPHPVGQGPEHRLEAFFQDTQERGRFAFFQHDHFFRGSDTGTQLEDHVRFALPFGPLGRLAATFFLAPHIRRLAQQRFRMIKDLAEGEGWRKWLEPVADPSA